MNTINFEIIITENEKLSSTLPESEIREGLFGWDAKGRASCFSFSFRSEPSSGAASGAGAWPEYGSGGGCWGHRRLQGFRKVMRFRIRSQQWGSLWGVLAFGVFESVGHVFGPFSFSNKKKCFSFIYLFLFMEYRKGKWLVQVFFFLFFLVFKFRKLLFSSQKILKSDKLN